jgi:hypothetical protein
MVAFLAVVLAASCTPEDLPDNDDGIQAKPTGTLEVWFKISHPWLPLDKIVPAELHVATDAMEIYKGNYIQSANVTNYQNRYYFYLEPGSYYYEAVIACLCGGDSCSAGGFPGNQWGTKSTMGKFTIEKDKMVQVIPFFQ